MRPQYTSSIDVTALPSAPLRACSTFPPSAGIYFVLTADHAVLYVGSSRNIRNRWSGHQIRKTSIIDLQGGRLAWLLTRGMVDLLSMERALIDRFNPPLNDWHGGRYHRLGQIRLPM